MAIPIKMPDLGTTVEEVTLVAWLKQVGEPVKRGEPLCEVETDKATDQLESVAAGVLLRQVVPAKSEVRSGTVIAYVGSPGEIIQEEVAPAPTLGQDPAPQPVAVKADTERRVPPVIRNLAKREGVNLDAVTGTGPGGRITRDDVLRAKQTSAPAGKSGVPYSKEQLSVARRVSRSNREIPTIDLMASIDMSAIIDRRRSLQEENSRKVAFDGFFLFGAARSIKQFPSFAAHAGDDLLHKHKTIDVCLAVSHERKLYLPVVLNADKLALDEIQMEIDRLVENVRSGRIRSKDLAGGCFTVSNLGMYPVDCFQMIIPPEQSAALAIGATQQQAVVKDGRIVARPICTVALSVDHRMINGAEAAEFLKHLKDTLEQL
ncbi:MAG: 2-oxo acid dehydrogenase subunit E2 [Planctomycetes bacterium]|nr:2-oxo acid dehydrogenase subunit E2 [Planctomycetota bacterium]